MPKPDTVIGMNAQTNLQSWDDVLGWFSSSEFDAAIDIILTDTDDPTTVLAPYTDIQWDEISVVIICDSIGVFNSAWDNIATELALDHSTYLEYPDPSYLASRGVMVVADRLSHHRIDWSGLVKETIQFLSRNGKNVVFIFMGGDAQRHSLNVNLHKHLVLNVNHPSDETTMGFFGSRVFSKANEYLTQHGWTPVEWGV